MGNVHNQPQVRPFFRLMSKHHKISDRWSDVMLRYAQFFHDQCSLPAVHAGKTVITIFDSRAVGFSNVDRYLQDKNVDILSTHFPCLADKTGIFGLPWFLSSFVHAFVQMSMPVSMRKRFKVYKKESIIRDLGEERVPKQFGGKLVLRPLVNVSKHKLRSLKDHFTEWGLQEWEANKILHSYA